MDFHKRQTASKKPKYSPELQKRINAAKASKKEGLLGKVKRKLGLKKEEVDFQEGTATDVAIKAIEKTKPPYLSKRSAIIRQLKQRQLSKYLKQRDKKKEQTNEAAAWTKKSGKSESGGLNEKGRKSYERENPGSDLKAPSKKVGNPRRASFCARMSGMKKKLTSKKTANDPNSRINKSLRAWNC